MLVLCAASGWGGGGATRLAPFQHLPNEAEYRVQIVRFCIMLQGPLDQRCPLIAKRPLRPPSCDWL